MTVIVSHVLEARRVLSGMVIVFHDVKLDFDRSCDVKHRAMPDPLTGLSNRAEFEERPAAVMAIDLDRFKAVNDAADPAAGDAIGEVCRLAMRISDSVGRLGGDEFAIILDNYPEDRATDIAQKLLRALNPMEFEWKGSRSTILLGRRPIKLVISPNETDAACRESPRKATRCPSN